MISPEFRKELEEIVKYHARIHVGDYGLSADLDNPDEIIQAVLEHLEINGFLNVEI